MRDNHLCLRVDVDFRWVFMERVRQDPLVEAPRRKFTTRGPVDHLFGGWGLYEKLGSESVLVGSDFIQPLAWWNSALLSTRRYGLATKLKEKSIGPTSPGPDM